MNQQGKTLNDWLANLVGDEGLKTDLHVKLSNEEYIKMGVTIVVAIGIGSILWHITGNVIGKN